jgi:hypothetical protein
MYLLETEYMGLEISKTTILWMVNALPDLFNYKAVAKYEE